MQAVLPDMRTRRWAASSTSPPGQPGALASSARTTTRPRPDSRGSPAATPHGS
jgi:hypothetical protein